MQIKVVGDTSFLFVMAVAAEYGPHLQARFQPLFTGVGPVEAAVTLAVTLAQLRAEGALPDVVVCLGSAGSRTLDHTGVYQVATVSYRDMDATALGFAKGVTPLLDLPAVLDLPLQVAGIPLASLATGASVVSGAGYDGIAADMVDMETYAVLRVCQRFALPLIGLRGISDGKAEVTGMADWTEYLHIIDEKLASAVDKVLAEVPARQDWRQDRRRNWRPGH
jgi:adenosylhomocysteine nucleosidase